ncbi:MAG: type II secretion system protein [Patescibacteria group bacterium]
MNNLKKGFTLIELLIVIAILAILSVAVVLVLNPAELIKQARDSTRISDLSAINSAIALYLVDVATPYFGSATTACVTTSTATFATTTTALNPWASGAAQFVNTSSSVTGGGWVTVNFGAISAGSPIAKLPIDPVNSAAYWYGYACNGLNYKLATVFESTKYSSATTGYMRNSYDGGTSNGFYEVGNSLVL